MTVERSRSQSQPVQDPPGGTTELFKLSIPLIISASFLTLQLCLDRVLITWLGNDEVAASMPAVMLYATLMAFIGSTIQYASVFVSQYSGANTPGRIGTVIWQTVWLALCGGVLFLFLIPLAPALFKLSGHEPAVALQETLYFQSLCYAALPTLLVGVINAFFSGRGETWKVLFINIIGLAVNAPFAYAWILGAWGFPQLGVTGAGYATVLGSSASLLVGITLLLPQRYEQEFHLRSAWAYNHAIMKRFLKFGLPNGLMQFMDMVAWTAFVFLVVSMGKIDGAATNVAFTINLVAFLPLMGLGQGVEILVGRRQGEMRPEISARTTWTGLYWAMAYAVGISAFYIIVPHWFSAPFAYAADPEQWQQVEPVVHRLLIFVGIYTVGDTLNIIFSFALRGAGDTRFVAAMGIGLAWPIMVIPTVIAVQYGWGVIGAWTFATAYIFALSMAFLFRFLHGHWRTMQVIEPVVIVESEKQPVMTATG